MSRCQRRAEFAGDANHFGSSDPKSITLDRKLLTVAADDQSKTYGSPNPNLAFTYAGFVLDEDGAVLGTEPACVADAGRYSPVADSPYSITCSGGDDDNYDFNYIGGELTITPTDALVNYIGETVFVSSGSGSTTVRTVLTASLQAVDEEFALGTATWT